VTSRHSVLVIAWSLVLSLIDLGSALEQFESPGPRSSVRYCGERRFAHQRGGFNLFRKER
jgi:hypothetical protein